MLADILILGAVTLVAGLFALFSALSFVQLPEQSGIYMQDRH
jgi:hypothetical protein